MSFLSGTQMEEIWSGPSVSYTQQAAASAAAQFLMPGASGAWEQPYIPANFWQMGTRKQRARIELAGTMGSTGGTATTVILTVGLTNLPNTATLGNGGGALCASTAITITSLAAGTGWRFKADLLTRNVGYGVSSVSTSLLTDGEVSIGTLGASAPATLLSTIDCMSLYWVYATVTFSTAVTTNTCQLTRVDVYGQN
jgi:hypothetical protein